MKKILFTILLASTIWSCSVDKEFVREENQQRVIGDSTRNFKLELVEESFDFDGWENGIGIKVPPYDWGYKVSYSPKVHNGTVYDTVFTYNCLIRNKAQIDYSGANDFVVDKELSGIPTGNGGYGYDGILAIYTVQNSKVVAEVIKQNFNMSATTLEIGYDPSQQINYNEGYDNAPFMFLPAGTGDNYTNRAVARSGKQLVIIVLNPDGLIPQENTPATTVVLPINVTINSTNAGFLGYAVVDESAIAENPTIPPDELEVTTNPRGKRWVKLDWHCPYHGDGINTFYIPHHFKVVRTINGTSKVVYDNEDISEYLDDKIQGNPQSITYTITTTVIGLGESTPLTVTVNR